MTYSFKTRILPGAFAIGRSYLQNNGYVLVDETDFFVAQIHFQGGGAYAIIIKAFRRTRFVNSMSLFQIVQEDVNCSFA